MDVQMEKEMLKYMFNLWVKEIVALMNFACTGLPGRINIQKHFSLMFHLSYTCIINITLCGQYGEIWFSSSAGGGVGDLIKVCLQWLFI